MIDRQISVIIPCHNAVDTITVQLDAVAAQLPVDAEIVVVDDASNDDTADAVRRWGEGHDSTQLHIMSRARRGGPNASRNEGVRRSSGTTLLFCDGDDIVADGWLRALAAAAADRTIAGGVYAPFSGDQPDASEVTSNTEWAGATTAHGWPYALGGCLGVRRDTLIDVGGFDEAITSGGTEVELAIRAQVSHEVNVATVPDAVVHYRIPPPVSTCAWLQREFRKERGRAYLRAKFGAEVIPDRSLRHLLALWATLPGSAVAAVRRRDDRWKFARTVGKAVGWVFWTPIVTIGVALGAASFSERLLANPTSS